MIFKLKPLKFNYMTESMDLSTFKENILQGSNAVNFIRYIGANDDYNDMILSLDKDLALEVNYNRVSDLDIVMSSDNLLDAYAKFLKYKDESPKEYFDCNLLHRFNDDNLEWTQKQAFKNTLDLFIKYKIDVNDSIIKTFLIKILHWSKVYLEDLFIDNRAKVFVYVGKIKLQKMLFLYFLNQLGCNILYLNPYSDVLDEIPFCNDFSNLYQANGLSEPNFIPTSYQKPIKKQIDTANVPASIANSPVNTAKAPVNTAKAPANITNSPANTLAAPQMNYDRKLTYEELAMLSSSIVMINVLDGSGKVIGSGSGVIISSKGYILTNCHVISGGSDYNIIFEDNTYSEIICELVKYNQDVDLALIKVHTNCTPLPLRITKEIVRGEQIVAIGSPLGLLNTISDGIISAKRTIHTSKIPMLQFTAPTSSGSSGGALLDLYGNLIGITTAGFADAQNLNLAVDNHTIQFFAKNFIEYVV